MWAISCGIKVGAENNVYSTIRQVYLTTLSGSIFFDIQSFIHLCRIYLWSLYKDKVLEMKLQTKEVNNLRLLFSVTKYIPQWFHPFKFLQEVIRIPLCSSQYVGVSIKNPCQLIGKKWKLGALFCNHCVWKNY